MFVDERESLIGVRRVLTEEERTVAKNAIAFVKEQERKRSRGAWRSDSSKAEAAKKKRMEQEKKLGNRVTEVIN